MQQRIPARRITIRAKAGARRALLLFAGGLGIGLGLGLALWAHAALADSPLQLCAKGNGQVYSASSGSCPADAPTALPPVARQTDLAALESRVTKLEALLAGVSLSSDGSTLTIAGNSTLKRVLFSGVNVQVVNGSGSESTLNGLGNLIVGYADIPFSGFDTGSHNLITGDFNGWQSYGGFVAGDHNLLAGAFASVSGGAGNFASGENAAVGGGVGNTASAYGAAVSGGERNTASGTDAVVSGGSENTASGLWDSILGGHQENIAGNIDCGYFPDSPTTSHC
jgi:hypothetical protein